MCNVQYFVLNKEYETMEREFKVDVHQSLALIVL